MAGQRPDEHETDPREAGATDSRDRQQSDRVVPDQTGEIDHADAAVDEADRESFPASDPPPGPASIGKSRCQDSQR